MIEETNALDRWRDRDAERRLKQLIDCNYCGFAIAHAPCTNASHEAFQGDILKHPLLSWILRPDVAVERMGVTRLLEHVATKAEATSKDRDEWKERATSLQQELADRSWKKQGEDIEDEVFEDSPELIEIIRQAVRALSRE